jgi:hypothetical protein
MPSYSPAEKSHIADAAARGVPWDEIGASLSPPRSSEAVQLAARRMRKRGEWPTNESAVRLRPEGPGRPCNRVRTVPVSVRLAPEVDMALRTVAKSAGVRVGKVVDEAVKRAVKRLQGKRVSGPPLGLARGGTVSISAGNKSETVSVCVDAAAFEALQKSAAAKDIAPMTAVHDAVVRLLQDLNFKVSAG